MNSNAATLIAIPFIVMAGSGLSGPAMTMIAILMGWPAPDFLGSVGSPGGQ
jgi:hypothetical protein